MSERTTRKQVEGTFARFAEASGIPRLQLEHHPGGYIIYQGMPEGEGSGVSEPFGSRLRGPSEMWSTLSFAIQVLTHRDIDPESYPD